jgi:hypothetical protein
MTGNVEFASMCPSLEADISIVRVDAAMFYVFNWMPQ